MKTYKFSFEDIKQSSEMIVLFGSLAKMHHLECRVKAVGFVVAKVQASPLFVGLYKHGYLAARKSSEKILLSKRYDVAQELQPILKTDVCPFEKLLEMN